MFDSLHNASSPLLLANVWDVPSAKVAEKAGFSAMGTSSAAVAHMLGYEDGENIPFEELYYIVERIAKSTNLPLSVDLEAGYSPTPEGIVANIARLAELGVVGVNLEDSLFKGVRALRPVKDFANTLQQITTLLAEQNISMFLNVRTDAFLVENPAPLEETLPRIKAYEQAGANGVFVPKVTATEDIRQIVASTNLPVNVLSMPDLPDFATLHQLGVKRISMGNFVHASQQENLAQTLATILDDQNFSSICR